ncbi:MAG: hypothetical protein O7G85_05965 [Planctomycetota bacterium]|nr:hypothetical protein [Planctomycetota bacterium]
MSFSSKVSSLQAYNILLFRSVLHPEFFEIEGRRCIQHGEYEFESWIYKGGHVARFEHSGLCITEVVTDDMSQLPERGLVTNLPCAGEKEHEEEFSDRINYMASIQTETLTDHLFLGTYNELLEHGRNSNALMTIWGDQPEKPNLSLFDMQRYSDEVHMQGYHLRSDCGLVLRTQSIFQVATSTD